MTGFDERGLEFIGFLPFYQQFFFAVFSLQNEEIGVGEGSFAEPVSSGLKVCDGKPGCFPRIRVCAEFAVIFLYDAHVCIGENPSTGVSVRFTVYADGLQVRLCDAGFFQQFSAGGFQTGFGWNAETSGECPFVPEGMTASFDEEDLQSLDVDFSDVGLVSVQCE